MEECDSCELNYWQFIAEFYRKDDKSINFLWQHGCLPRSVKYPKCDTQCDFRSDKHLWRCPGLYTYKKQRGGDFVILPLVIVRALF